MPVNYQFVSPDSQYFFTTNGAHLAGASLDQLRTSTEFRAIEARVAEKYDNVVVVMGDKATFEKTALGVQLAEETNAVGRTRYIYIDTSTTSIKTEDGLYKSLT